MKEYLLSCGLEHKVEESEVKQRISRVPVLFSLATRNSNGFFISSALFFFFFLFSGRFIEPGHVDGLGFDIQFCNILFKLKSEISGVVLGDTDTCTMMYPQGVSNRVVPVPETPH